MAVTFGRSPIVLTAVGDSLLSALGKARGDEGIARFSFSHYRVLTGSNSGVTEVLDRVGGSVIFRTTLLSAQDQAEIFDMGHAQEDLYVSKLPVGAEIHAYYT
jgi:hypothetical protein